jgi:hypothetical protein
MTPQHINIHYFYLTTSVPFYLEPTFTDTETIVAPHRLLFLIKFNYTFVVMLTLFTQYYNKENQSF